jgi:DNA-binding IclR family transcriptional regulator
LARLALSASRGLDVIDLLTSFPGRAFTLSEIAKATRINVASCHAVIGALLERGYLARAANPRTYRLGPVLVAAGEAALKSQPLIERAKTAAEALAREIAVPVLLSGVVGEEIVGLVSIPDAAGRGPGLRVGERLPLAAPVGAPFLAWSSEAAISAWIERHGPLAEPRLAETWREALALTRSRGFHVTLRAPDSETLSGVMAEMATGRNVIAYREQITQLVRSLDHQMAQPESLQPEACYDIILIAAPLFDQSGEAVFNLCLGGFAEALSGAAILSHGERLVRTCVQIMREVRAAPQAGREGV